MAVHHRFEAPIADARDHHDLLQQIVVFAEVFMQESVFVFECFAKSGHRDVATWHEPSITHGWPLPTASPTAVTVSGQAW